MTEFDLAQAGFINSSGSWFNTYTTDMNRRPYVRIKITRGKFERYWECEVRDLVTDRYVIFNFMAEETLAEQFQYIVDVLGWDIKFPTCGGLFQFLGVPAWLEPLISKVMVTHKAQQATAEHVLWLGNLDVIQVFYIECAPEDNLFQKAKIFEISTRAKGGEHLVLATGGDAINAFLKEIVKEAEA